MAKREPKWLNPVRLVLEELLPPETAFILVAQEPDERNFSIIATCDTDEIPGGLINVIRSIKGDA